MDLETLKNQYSQEQGYPNWKELRHWRGISEVADGYMNEICIRAQKAALEKAAENALLNLSNNINCQERSRTSKQKIVLIEGLWGTYDEKINVDRTSITNPENLIQ